MLLLKFDVVEVWYFKVGSMDSIASWNLKRVKIFVHFLLFRIAPASWGHQPFCKERSDIMPILTQRLSTLQPRIHVGARTTLRVLSAQRPDKPTCEQGERTNTAILMPAKLPVTSHWPHGGSPRPHHWVGRQTRASSRDAALPWTLLHIPAC